MGCVHMGGVHGRCAWEVCMGGVHGMCAWEVCMGCREVSSISCVCVTFWYVSVNMAMSRLTSTIDMTTVYRKSTCRARCKYAGGSAAAQLCSGQGPPFEWRWRTGWPRGTCASKWSISTCKQGSATTHDLAPEEGGTRDGDVRSKSRDQAMSSHAWPRHVKSSQVIGVYLAEDGPEARDDRLLPRRRSERAVVLAVAGLEEAA
jgi:hypothetical protein